MLSFRKPKGKMKLQLKGFLLIILQLSNQRFGQGMKA